MKSLHVILTLFLLFTTTLFSNELSLTQQERDWLEKHPIIKVSNEDDWAPFDFSVNGEAKGYSVDIIKEIAKIVGVKVVFVNGYSWGELLQEFDKGNIDLMHVINKNKQRAKKYSFSPAYMPWSLSYFVRNDETNIRSEEDFSGKKIAAGEGWYVTKVLKEKFPKANIIEYKNSEAMFKALSSSQVDIAIDNILAANYTMIEHILTNIKHLGYTNLIDSGLTNLYFASHKGDL